jgi:sterol desaturase/sphingolipid hydroxylase (fatty acid hydroxylase superfamily)
MNLFYVFSIISGTFSLSTITAYFICSYNNYPFVNPKMNYTECLIRFIELLKNIPLLLCHSTGFLYIMSDNILPYGHHTWIESAISMFTYCLLVEANYYIYHRFIHKYYYVVVHKKHHENVIVYPFDTFHSTHIDDFASIISLGLPLMFMKISILEQAIITYIYITSSYLSHSELFWHDHSIHHKLLKYNFCILFPVFDIVFGTYKIE